MIKEHRIEKRRLRKMHKQATESNSTVQAQQSAAAFHNNTFFDPHLNDNVTTAALSTGTAADAAMGIPTTDFHQRKSQSPSNSLLVTFSQALFPIPAWPACHQMTSRRTSQLLALHLPMPSPTLSEPSFTPKVAVPQLSTPSLPSIANRNTNHLCLVAMTLQSLGILSKHVAILNSLRLHTKRPSTRNRQTNSSLSYNKFPRVRLKSCCNLIMKSPRPGSMRPKQ